MSMATAAAAIDYISLLTDTCTIRRYTAGTEGSHGMTGDIWRNFATSVACRYDPSASGEVALGQEMVVRDAVLFLLVGQDITEKDRVRTIARDGTTLVAEDCDILAVQIPSGTNHHKEVSLAFTRT